MSSKGSHDHMSPQESDAIDPYIVTWDGDTDLADPRNWATWKKWTILLLGSTLALIVTVGSSSYTLTQGYSVAGELLSLTRTSYDHLEQDLNTNREVATLGLSLYTLALGIGPLLLAPLSESYGRRPVCQASLVLFIIWNIPCAIAQNITTELIGRFFSGMAGSAFLTVSGGVVGDLFAPSELGLPMLIFTLLTFLGPNTGPLLGGLLDQYYHWRWVFYMLMIWSTTILICFLWVPETYRSKLLEQKARRLRQQTQDPRFRAGSELHHRSTSAMVLQSCRRPFSLLLHEPMVACLSLLTAVLLGVQYLLFGAYAYAFHSVYSFTPSQIGLAFLGIGAGAVIGASSFPIWSRSQQRQIMKNNNEAEPEFVLLQVAVGAYLLPASLLWIGWSCRSDVHWIVPIAGGALFGIGGLLVFTGVWSFLVGAYPDYAASALGANAFTRLVFAGTFPLFGNQMYEALGIGWASTTLGLMALACTPFPLLFMVYGKRLRARSTRTSR